MEFMNIEPVMELANVPLSDFQTSAKYFLIYAPAFDIVYLVRKVDTKTHRGVMFEMSWKYSHIFCAAEMPIEDTNRVVYACEEAWYQIAMFRQKHLN